MLYLWKGRAQILGMSRQKKRRRRSTHCRSREACGSRGRRRRKKPHDEESSSQTREGTRRTSSVNKPVQNCLQDERQGLQGDHRQWEHG
jgi:hypothetical protein